MTEWHRDWRIDFEYGYYTATHKDFDASWGGEEDGWIGSHPTLAARSIAVLREEIDYWYDEQDDCCDSGRVWNNADPTSGQWVPCEKHGGAL